MSALTLRQRGTALAAVALGTVVVVSAILLPTSATPGGFLPASPRSDGGHDTEFRVAGDGTLPETRPDLRSPHEPLSTQERGYAVHLARTALPVTATDVTGDPGGEVVAADLPPLAERSSSRLVSVAIYDYSVDRLHRLLVDLTRRSVVGTESAEGLQLPPTPTEAAVALDLAVKAEPAPRFHREYRAITGNPLLTPDQVRAVAGVWRPAYPAAAGRGHTAACGRHRCLQLLIAVPTGQYLNTQDLAVDLSTGSVLTIEQPEARDEQ